MPEPYPGWDDWPVYLRFTEDFETNPDHQVEPYAKLAESIVAPLVAAGRGYQCHMPGENSQVKAALALMGLEPTLRGKAQGMVASAIRRGGALAMPWYAVADVLRSRQFGVRRPDPTTWQVRSEWPLLDPTGKHIGKYLALPGIRLPIDVHPATPRSWIMAPSRIMLTEGVIKGDSTLTAVLREGGVTEDILAGDDESRYPWHALHDAMDEFPAANRTLVVSIAGVANWHQHAADWNDIGTDGAPVIIAFDGDVASNPQVWRQASQLWEYLSGPRRAVPSLLDLAIPTAGANGTTSYTHIGVDDYFAAIGRLPDLLERQEAELPPNPASHAAAKWGGIHMDDVRAVAYRLEDVYDASGTYLRTDSVDAAALIGRVLAVTTRRQLTATIEETGIVSDSEVDAGAEERASIEISWLTGEGARVDRVIDGPARILADAPSTWTRIADHSTPASVMRHPDWPPTAEWLAGVKNHRSEECEVTTQWNAQGWVPCDPAGDQWAFTLGDTAITRGGTVAGQRWAPLSSAEVRNIGSFGLPEVPADDEAAELVRIVVDAYCYRIWGDPAIGAAALCLMVRPLVPGIRSQASLFVLGAKGVGKSLVASAIMAGYQPRPGIWTEDRLPGSAGSTAAANEHLRAVLPIHVVDDLAPSTDEHAARRQEAAVTNAIRESFNGTGRDRMTSAMKAQRSFTPKAVTIYTAENGLDVASAVGRTLRLRVGPDSLLPDTDAQGRLGGYALLRELRDQTNAPARMIAWLAQQLAERIATDGWASVRTRFVGDREIRLEDALSWHFGGDGKQRRAARIIADVLLGLDVLVQAAGPLSAIRPADHNRIEQSVGRAVRAQSDEGTELTPGRALIAAIQTALSSGGAHLTNAAGSSPIGAAPPLLVGWVESGEFPRPSGPRIGYVEKRDSIAYAIFDTTAAFTAAQKAAPRLVPPGTKGPDSWRAVWDEGLADGWKRKSPSHATARILGREVVPVPLNLIAPTIGLAPEPSALKPELSDDRRNDFAA